MHVTCLSSTEHQKSESATQECYALLKDPGDGTPDIAIESTPDIWSTLKDCWGMIRQDSAVET